MNSQLRVRGLFKSYGQSQPVVENINLQVQRGEFVVLVGPPGSGKTTLLRMIAGLEDPNGGEIWIDGTQVFGPKNDLPPADRGVAMVFQDDALYPHMTVRENFEFGLKHGRRASEIDEEERDRRVRNAAEVLGLEALLEKKPPQLSSGQRQRVALGRALVKEPELFLFDEPLSNLEMQVRTGTRVELAALHRRLGSTSIYVTHDQVEAMTLADRLIVLKDAVIQQEGKPMDLYRDPDNRFVASYLGSPAMNFLDGRIDTREGEKVFAYADGDQEGVIPLKFLHSAPQSDAPGIALGVRSESLRVARSPDEFEPFVPLMAGTAALVDVSESSLAFSASPPFPGPRIVIWARVLLVEPHGHEVHLILSVGKARWVVRANETDLMPGEGCWLDLDREALYWFDAAGERLRGPEVVSLESSAIGSAAHEAEDIAAKGLVKVARPKSELDDVEAKRKEPRLGK